MKKYESRRGSTIERIGELAISMKPVMLGAVERFATIVAADFDVKVEFTLHAGEEAKLDGPPEDCCEGVAPYIEIHKIKADASVHFSGDGMDATASRGVDLKELFSSNQIDKLAEKLLEAERAEVD